VNSANPQLLDGKRVRDSILAELTYRIERLRTHSRPPGLAVVLVGQDPASEIYVRSKVQTSRDLGIRSEKHTPPENISTAGMLELIDSLNSRDEIDGILVQMPLPKQIDSRAVLMAVSPEKDVDGFHPLNVGNLVANRPAPRSCTPAGIIELLKRYNIPIAGREAVVVGRSDIVGKPMALMLLHEHATVTICHSRTTDLPGVCRRADILIAAIGRPAIITAEHIKPGAIVVDVGMNRLNRREDVDRIFRGSPERLAQFDQKGTVLIGDVHPLDVVERASAYTPVPGGVGPLTIAMLMSNTVEAAERRLGVCSA
jgi:methylenetetrahydrofolate dehydrogenase (NADP+)/methenyltetrahydrofolate cyclohydrolase